MIALLLTPIARYVVIALVIIGVLGGTYGMGRHDGAAKVEARVAAAVAAEQLRQSAVRAQALDKAVSRELQARTDANAAEQKAADYEAILARQPEPAPTTDGKCPPRFLLGPDDVRDLGVLQH